MRRNILLQLLEPLRPLFPTALRVLVALGQLAVPAVVQAQFNYTTNNGTITITGYTGPAGAVVIPSAITGLPVTRIGEGAFGSSGLTSVTIPSSVTNVGDNAFRFCTSLISVSIPNSVISIGLQAFADTGLTSVTIPNGVTSIGYGGFFGCLSLTNVTIGNSVTNLGIIAFAHCYNLANVMIGSSVISIGEQAFYGCRLTSVTIPDSVATIGDGAFATCRGLTNVTIGNSVTSIGGTAFLYCDSLTSISIPSSVTNIGILPFAYCPSLTAITVDALNPFYRSVAGVLFDKNQTLLIQYPAGTGGSAYTIPNTVTTIGDAAFSLSTNLTSVTIPNSVTTIKEGGFNSCTSLTNITIPSSVASFGGYVFSNCENLSGVYFQGNAPSVGLSDFFNVNNATVYYLPGTTGWNPTFADRPTALWELPNPLILNHGPGFGGQPSAFGFIISWATNIPVVVEACTNLANPIWSPVRTNTLTDGSSYFSDPQWTNHASRFYRLRSP